MQDDDDTLECRKSDLLTLIVAEQHRYQGHAKYNYIAAQTLSWMSLLLGAIAAVLGLMNWVTNFNVGLLAAASTAALTISQKAGFQQKANWHYRKVDQMKALRAHLTFELPLKPTIDDIAAVSRALSDMNIRMSKQWEDMKHDTNLGGPH